MPKPDRRTRQRKGLTVFTDRDRKFLRDTVAQIGGVSKELHAEHHVTTIPGLHEKLGDIHAWVSEKKAQEERRKNRWHKFLDEGWREAGKWAVRVLLALFVAGLAGTKAYEAISKLF